MTLACDGAARAAALLCALLARPEPDPQAQGSAAPPKKLEFLLDRIEGATIESPLATLKPPGLERIELDRAPVEHVGDEGRLRIVRLAVSATPGSLRLLSGTDAAARAGGTAPEATAQLVPARRQIELARLSIFSGLRRERDFEGPLWVSLDEPGEWTLPLARHGCALRGRLTARAEVAPTEGPPVTPTLEVEVGGATIATFHPANLAQGGELELPPAIGSTEIRWKATDVSRREGRTIQLGLLDLEAVDGRDRVEVRAADAEKLAGLVLEYAPRVPPAVVPFRDSPAPGTRTLQSVELVPGRVFVIADEKRSFSVQLDGEPAAESTEPVRELAFDVASGGVHAVSVTTSARPVGEFWLVQPRARLLALRDVGAALREPLPPVRGLEREDGDPHVRHVTLGDDTRRALLAPPPATARFPVRLEKGDRIEGAIGAVVFAADGPPGGMLRAEVAWIDASGARTVLHRERIAVAPPFEWIPFRVAPEVTGEGTLELAIARGRDRGSHDEMAAFAEPAIVRARARRQPNLLVYLIDTLRADHCTPWGYARETTPALGRLASESLVFERAYSQAPWTRPSVATLFTGRLYSFHGAGKRFGLAPELETLAEVVRAAGYATGAFLANPNVHAESLNFEQGFSMFHVAPGTAPGIPARSEVVTEAAQRWIEAQGGRPWFAFVHTLDPHDPYDPPPGTRGTWSRRGDASVEVAELERQSRAQRALATAGLEQAIDLYDEEILANDRSLGALLDALRASPRWDDTVVVVLADHGEQFEEHGGFGHGNVLWDELLHVPLVIKLDRRDGEPVRGRVAERVRCVDLFPTLLARLGAEPPASGTMGVDLAAAFSGSPLPELAVLAEEETERVCLLQGALKYIRFGARRRSPETWLFDLERDPGEKSDLDEAEPAILRRLEAELARVLAEYEARGFTRVIPGFEVRLDARAAAELRALGYVDDGEEADEGER